MPRRKWVLFLMLDMSMPELEAPHIVGHSEAQGAMRKLLFMLLLTGVSSNAVAERVKDDK